MLSLQTLELCPYPCIPWKSSRVLWNIIIFISFSKHKNSILFFYNFGFLALSPDIGILPYPSKRCNFAPIFFTLEFYPIPPNIAIVTLSLQTLTFWSYPSKDYNSAPILENIRILILSFQTLKFWPYPSKHWNSSLILPNTEILA